MEGQSSVRKQAKFSRRILCSSRRILRSLMPNEHPAFDREHTVTLSKSVEVVVFVIVRAFPLLLI